MADFYTSQTSPTVRKRFKSMGNDPTGKAWHAETVFVAEKDAEYETVAASQTAQVLGATGAAGDYIDGVLIIPATVAAGVVTLLDGATSIPIFVGGGTSPLVDTKPFYVKLGLRCLGAAWKITTGANVSVIASGDFT